MKQRKRSKVNYFLSFMRALWRPELLGIHEDLGRIRGAHRYAEIRSRPHYSLPCFWGWLIGME